MIHTKVPRLAQRAQDSQQPSVSAKRISQLVSNNGPGLESSGQKRPPGPFPAHSSQLSDGTAARLQDLPPTTAGKPIDMNDLLDENRQLRNLVIHLSKIILARTARL
jgi:hypothetical protein